MGTDNNEVVVSVWRDEDIWGPPATRTVHIGYKKPQKVYLSFEIDLSREVCGKDGWLVKKEAIRINGKKVTNFNPPLPEDEEELREVKRLDIDVTDLVKESGDPSGEKIEVKVAYKNPFVQLVPKDPRCMAKPLCSGKLKLWFTVRVQRGPEEQVRKYCYECGEPLKAGECPVLHGQNITVTKTKQCPQCKREIPDFARWCWYCRHRQPDIA